MTQHQPYDHALKSLLGDHAAEIIPQLIPDTEVIREQNVELKRELLRADLVYLVRHKGKPRTLNLELQTNADVDMEVRLLLYHAELYDAYRLPVLSVVLYLFEANFPHRPFGNRRTRRKTRFCCSSIAFFGSGRSMPESISKNTSFSCILFYRR